jgi:hypothetical protein
METGRVRSTLHSGECMEERHEKVEPPSGLLLRFPSPSQNLRSRHCYAVSEYPGVPIVHVRSSAVTDP